MAAGQEARYEKLKSFYVNGFGNALGAVCNCMSILSDPLYDAEEKAEISKHMEDSLNIVLSPYASIQDDLLSDPDFEDLRGVKVILGQIDTSADFVRKSYSDPTKADEIGRVVSDTYARAHELQAISSNWRMKINAIGAAIGKGEIFDETLPPQDEPGNA
ncbi:MAG: hypothetical protein V1813_04230 [Candidatus Aenigmatarchaeota archaeon]